jgi:hypothetical protein
MDSYVISRFLHILGALGLFMAIGFEWLGVPRLARSATRDDALAWLGVTSLAGRIGAVSLALILLPGLYMAGTRWGFTDWPVAALVGMVVMALLGGLLSGRPMAGLGRAIGAEHGPLSPAVLERLRSPALAMSLWTRTTVLLGIVGLMSFKPDLLTSLVVLALALVIGAVLSIAVARRAQRSPRPAEAARTG